MSDVIADLAPAQGEEPPAAPTTGIAAKAAFYVGSCGLLVAMAADSIAVLGRHTGFALLGAIEIVQASIVLIAASALVSATLARGHAAVHILTERLKPARRTALARFADGLSVVTVVLLATGSAILLADLWGGHERSELLHVPLRWLRVLMLAALLLVAAIFLRHAFGTRADDA